MRTITTAQQAVLNSGNQAEFCRVQVKDAGGTFRDLTTYPGFNAVKDAKWTEEIDQPHATFDITLFRELFRLSLTPYVAASALNHGFDPLSAYGALLGVNRELKIECAVVAMDSQPTSGDWFEVFHGRIETLDGGVDQDIEITGTSMSGRLSKQYIKTERVYSYAVDSGHAVALRVWEGNQVYVAGDYLLPASRGEGSGATPDDPGYNKFLKNHTPGTSGTTEPVWTTGSNQADGGAAWDYIGAPTTSGNAVEQVMQNLLDDNKAASDTAVTLYVPSSPGWFITEFIQQREFTMDALLALATQIGWDVRMLWRSGTSQFELTFYVPTRSSPTVLQTFGPSDYGTITQLQVDIATIRNAVRVIYPDASDLWPDGTPKRKLVEVSDSTSIGKYGELWMEMQEDQNSQIDSSAEATAFANAALSDCKDPTAELDVPLMRGFPWVELNDFYKFSANALQFDADQSLAVVQYQHESTGGKGIKTTLQTRGLPTIGARRYLRQSVHPKVPPKQMPHALAHFNGPLTPSAVITSAVGGHRVELHQSFDKRQLAEEYEHHVYRSSGVTLDSTTLKGVAKDRASEFGDLIAGATYYHRVVPRFRNGHQLVRGQPSAEVTFIAGQASAGHLSDGIALGDYPLNGGFETQLDGSGTGMPDHWKVTAGTPGTDFVVMTDNNGLSGGRYLRVISKASLTSIQSAEIPLVNDAADGSTRKTSRYLVTAWVKTKSTNSGANNLFVAAQGVDYQGNLIGGMSSSGVSFVNAASHLGNWQKVTAIVHSDGFTGMRGVYVLIYQDTTGVVGSTYDVDEIRVVALGSPWYTIGGGGVTDNFQSVPGFGASGWVDETSGRPPGFRSERGKIELAGAVKSGGVGSSNPIWTMPSGWFPPFQVQRTVVDGAGAAQLLIIDTAGKVYLAAGNTSKVSLDGISWDRF